PRYRTGEYVVQEFVRGAELTVAVLAGRVGRPLAIALPPGSVYSFARKYLLRPQREPLGDLALAVRVRATALKLARLFAVNWAARVDFIAEPGGRLCFLECDVAPLIALGSAFAESLSAAGVHPHHARDCDDATVGELRMRAMHPRCVAIGECGLDFNRNYSPHPDQEKWFVAQVELGLDTGKPLFLHSRDAHPRFAQILRTHGAK